MNEKDNRAGIMALINDLQHENRTMKMKLTLIENDVAKLQAASTASPSKAPSKSSKSAKQAQAQPQHLDQLLSGLNTALFILDTDNKFTHASKAFLKKIGLDDIKRISGGSYKDILIPIMMEKNLGLLTDAIESGTAETKSLFLEYELDLEASDPHFYKILVTPMFEKKDDADVRTGTMVQFDDMTELRNALDNLARANQSKSKFLATMSHEIRTPLNAIVGISDIELDNSAHPAATKASFDRINKSGNTLLNIINNILDLSKIETGTLELMPNKYDTAKALDEVLQLNLMRIGNKQVDFKVKIAENFPAELVGDELRVKQILNNLISNAIKYTERGSVSFEMNFKEYEDNTVLIFTIRDTGQGMSKEQLAAIVDGESTFFLENNRISDTAGLGISIIRSLVDMMNGQIMAESIEGSGSRFTVYLTQHPAEGGSAVLDKDTIETLQNFKYTEMQRASMVREHMPYGSVLIVDDMNINIFVAQGLMKPYGLSIDTALSGYEALDKVKEGKKYDIIFMDHMMPGMDGMETTQNIREEGYTLPVIALTANAIIGQDEVFLENGFDAFIAKPIDTGQLNDILNKFIRDKQPEAVLDAARKLKVQGDSDVAGTDASEGEAPADPLSVLRQMDELDVESAIEAMSGMEELYLDTVRLTLRLLPERIEKMDSFLNTELKSFTIEVHGLKSALKNIGASTLGNAASRLERAAIDEDQGYCDENYPSFRDGLDELKNKLNAALQEDEGEKESADKALLAPAIAAAKAAAEGYDRDTALEIISKHAAFTYGAEIDGLLGEIISVLEAFDCAAAVTLIEKVGGAV